MTHPLKTVAVLIANPALSSILSSTLAGAPSLRVRPFETELALKTYLRLVPADLVVIDFEGSELLAEDLRNDPAIASTDLHIIALASARTGTRGLSSRGSVDEIIIKPMSPRYLVERVLALLSRPRQGPLRKRAFDMRDWSHFGDNIVSLFGRTTQTLH